MQLDAGVIGYVDVEGGDFVGRESPKALLEGQLLQVPKGNVRALAGQPLGRADAAHPFGDHRFASMAAGLVPPERGGR